uniref:Uncharacterized protein n=1 Tax=Oryzias sinensis TaxID=183150 RepID=A0A8C7WYF2_9TELE
MEQHTTELFLPVKTPTGLQGLFFPFCSSRGQTDRKENIDSAIYRNTSFGDTCIDSKCCQIDIYLIISERPSASDSCCPLHPPTASWQQSPRSLLEQLYSAQDNRKTAARASLFCCYET